MTAWTVLAAALSLTLRAAPSPELADTVARTRASVVLLEVLDAGGQVLGNGTGFVVSADGRVVTNQHVIADAHQVRALLTDGTTRAGLGVLARNKERDVVILQLEGTGYTPLALDESGTTEGTRVFVVGSPMGLASTVTEGIVSATRRQIPEKLLRGSKSPGEVVQITAAISPGSSGSPVLTLDGKVLGVAQSIIVGADNIGFAVPAEVVQSMLDALPPGSPVGPFQPFPLGNAIASGVFFAVLLAAGLGYTLWERRKKKRAPTLFD